MARLLIWIAGLVAVYLLLRPKRRAQAAKQPPSGSEPMVRDRICDTFVPQADALVETGPDGTHYFCSERCRNRYLASQ